jgi:hypothetical protein
VTRARTSRRARTIAAAACTIPSIPGMLLGLLWLMAVAARPGVNGLAVALLLANIFAWIAYVVCADGWAAGRRVARGWPVGGALAAASYALDPLATGGTLGDGAAELLAGLVLVLPATLLAARLVAFHLGGRSAQAPPLTPPAGPPAP